MAILDRFASVTNLGKPEEPQSRVKTHIGRFLEEREANVAPASYSEVGRIAALPVRSPLTDEEFEEFNRNVLLSSAFREGFRLFRVQAEALYDYTTVGGLLGPIGVGWGKTLLSLMIANHEHSNGTEKIMLLIPSDVYSQLMEYDLRWARSKVPIGFTVHGMHKPRQNRVHLARSGRPGLYVFPYSLLSVQDTEDLLDGIRPQVIICDESHLVSRREAARTQRLLRYIEAAEPRGVALSGTFTKKSLMDYHHLGRWVLQDNCPFPYSPTMAKEWAAVIDASAPFSEGSTGPLVPLLNWARRTHPGEARRLRWGKSGFRHAYQMRFLATPGIVGTEDAQIGTSIVMANEPVASPQDTPGWQALMDFIQKAEEEWVTPNGDEIEHAIHLFKWLYELNSGFYNELYWPSPKQLVSKGLANSEAGAEHLLERALEHHRLQQEFAKELRTWIQYNGGPHLDTPLLVRSEMANHGSRKVGRTLFDRWNAMRAAEFEGMPERLKRAVRVCGFKVEAARRWAQARIGQDDGHGGIVWCYNQEVGRWAYDVIKKAGLPAVHCPAGEASNLAIRNPENADKIVIASISAHHRGKNLQHFRHSWHLQWPRSAALAEQMLGRTHRNGQLADTLRMVTCNTTEFDDLNFAACLNDACYQQQTVGARQKLIYASYSPMPKIFPPEALHERGFENQSLTRETRTILKNKFGNFAASRTSKK